MIHAADIQGRDDAPLVLAESVRRCLWFRHVFADRGHAGDELRQASLRIVKWSDTAKGFEILPRRLIVERALAWLNRNHRL